jgi:predicted Fe-Mo cluster-binding NifX family protein
MKIALTCQGPSLDQAMDRRFGRAAYILIVDTKTDAVEVIDNVTNTPASGAGIATAQLLVDKGVGAVITGQVGPNALSVLRAAELKLWQAGPHSARQNLADYQAGKLTELANFVQPHSGQGRNYENRRSQR